MNGKSLSVFIVDDEVSIVDWMIKNIEWEVYNCKIAGHSTNVSDALRYINEHPVDLLLTDISMPELSGMDLIKSVKEHFPEILIIVISAYDKFSYVKEAFQYGIINYCLKPIDVNELHECLRIAMMTISERQLNYYNQDKRVFRNSIFLNLLSGEISAVRLKEQSMLADVDFSVPAWQVVLMKISVLKESESIALLKYYREKEYMGYYCFLDANMNLVFILYGETVLHPCVKYVLQEINTRYIDSTLSMKELAENRGMSPAYLGTLFKEQTGELFNDYLLRNRLEKVLELLSCTKLNIGEIASVAGFYKIIFNHMIAISNRILLQSSVIQRRTIFMQV